MKELEEIILREARLGFIEKHGFVPPKGWVPPEWRSKPTAPSGATPNEEPSLLAHYRMREQQTEPAIKQDGNGAFG